MKENENCNCWINSIFWSHRDCVLNVKMWESRVAQWNSLAFCGLNHCHIIEFEIKNKRDATSIWNWSFFNCEIDSVHDFHIGKFNRRGFWIIALVVTFKDRPCLLEVFYCCCCEVFEGFKFPDSQVIVEFLTFSTWKVNSMVPKSCAAEHSHCLCSSQF